jgi:O-methyltransferase involved in polyketide biosynthesis
MYGRIPNASAAANYAGLVHLQAVDLNQLDQVESILTHILQTNNHDNNNDDKRWYTLLVSEALLMYLDDRVPDQLVKRCGEVFGSTSTSSSQGVSFFFADQFEGIRNQTEEEAGRRWLADVGWNLVDWLPNKPGVTRHAGIAQR